MISPPYPSVYRLFSIVLLASVSAAIAQAQETIQNLTGLTGLHMNVLTTGYTDPDLDLRQDISDLVELELRRANITIFEFVANQPDQNIPLLELIVDLERSTSRNSFVLRLAVKDHVLIRRNNIQIVATTYVNERSGSTPSEDTLSREVKNTVRQIMGEFSIAYRQVNPL